MFMPLSASMDRTCTQVQGHVQGMNSGDTAVLKVQGPPPGREGTPTGWHARMALLILLRKLRLSRSEAEAMRAAVSCSLLSEGVQLLN